MKRIKVLSHETEYERMWDQLKEEILDLKGDLEADESESMAFACQMVMDIMNELEGRETYY